MNKRVMLPSSSPLKYFPGNKISDFKVRLAQPIELDPTKWEVGLGEIQFTNSRYNIKEEKNSLKYVDWNGDVKDLLIPPVYYDSIKTIFQLLQEQVGEGIAFNFPKHSKGEIVIHSDGRLGMNNSDLAMCLGFHPSWVLETGETIGLSLPNIQKHSSLYVYCNLIKNQIIGDVQAPLLRVVPILTKHSEHSYIHYDRPHFFPINQSYIDFIEINITDSTGEFISFEQGTLLVTLVFERKKLLLL